MNFVFRNWTLAMQSQCILEFQYRQTETVRVVPTYSRLSKDGAEVDLEGLRVDPQFLPISQTAERFDYRDISRMRAISAPLELRGVVVQKVDAETGEVTCQNERFGRS